MQMDISRSSSSEISEKVELPQPTSASVLPVPAPSGIGRQLLSFPVVLAVSLAYMVYAFARGDVADPDLWWHLRNAQYLLTHGHLPVVEAYSFAAPGSVRPSLRIPRGSTLLSGIQIRRISCGFFSYFPALHDDSHRYLSTCLPCQ